MKTLFLATILFSGAAVAQVNIDDALQIRNRKMVITAPGASVGRIDAEAVKKAATNLKGSVAIQFGPNESVKLNNREAARSGGVIVGSGTNGDKSVVKVVPPLRPVMGVTVTGREGSLNTGHNFCARFLNPSAEKYFVKCIPIGSQLRLPYEGRYLLFLDSDIRLGKSSVEVSIKKGDQFIIPLREIQIDAYLELKGHRLIIDITAKEEQRKLLLYAQHSANLKSLVEGSIEFFERGHLGAIGSTYSSTGVPSFYNVFPGTYEVIWHFQADQYDSTPNIVVE